MNPETHTDDVVSNGRSQDTLAIEVVEVPFYGDSIEAARDTRDGTAYVSIRRVCENLGIDTETQQQKLKGYHWATPGMIPGVAQDGKQRELMFLPLAQVPMWLTTISPSKIGAGPEQAEKLRRYQLEAVDVLYRHFVGPQVAQDEDPIVAMARSAASLAQSVIATRQAQLALEGKVDTIQGDVGEIKVDLAATKRTLGKMIVRRAESINALGYVERSDQPAAPLTTRAKVKILVDAYVAAKEGLKHKDIWSYLYRQFRARYHFDVYSRAKNPANAGISKLEIIELAGRIEDFYAMTSELLS